MKENPGDQNALFGVASCQFSLGKTEAARATLKDLLAVFPTNSRALFLLAKIEWADEKPQEALRQLRKAERLTPRESDITHLMIDVLRRLNQTEEAEKYVQRQQEILELNEQYNKLKKQLRREPGNVEIRFQMAQIDLRLGRDDEAESWLQMVLNLDPNHAKALEAIEELRERGGRTNPAAEKPKVPGGK
jgi:predicted Zn-dependent protease